MDPTPVAELDTAAGVDDPSAARCPFPHAAMAAAAEPIVAPEPAAAHCPVPHGAASTTPALAPDIAGGCPVMHGPNGVRRSKADLVVRKVLRIKERAPGESQATAYAAFQKSMLISATRCTLTYVVFPFLLPMLSFLHGGAPIIGVVIGSVAMVADVFTIRRFFAIDHKWRWYFCSIVFGIMCLLSVLLVHDITAVVHNITS